LWNIWQRELLIQIAQVQLALLFYTFISCFGKLEIWDTAGLERFQKFLPNYCKNALCCIIAIDLTMPESFEEGKIWNSFFEKNSQIQNCLKVVVGTKLDLVNENVECITRVNASKWANEINSLYFESSAKTGHNIMFMFQAIAQKLEERFVSFPAVEEKNSIRLEPSKPAPKTDFCYRTPPQQQEDIVLKDRKTIYIRRKNDGLRYALICPSTMEKLILEVQKLMGDKEITQIREDQTVICDIELIEDKKEYEVITKNGNTGSTCLLS